MKKFKSKKWVNYGFGLVALVGLSTSLAVACSKAKKEPIIQTKATEQTNENNQNNEEIALMQAFAAKKEAAKEKINNLANLLADEKVDFINRIQCINHYSKEDEINSIINEAELKDQQNLFAAQEALRLKREREENAKENLRTKKKQAKARINKLVNLSDSEKQSFLNRIDQVIDPSKVDDVISITREAVEKDKLNLIIKNKLTPISAKSFLLNKKYYLRFEFKTTKETFELVEKNPLSLQIDVFKNGGFIGTFDETSASYPTKDKKDVYAIKIEDTKDGMVILKIETFNHLPDENISSEYKYQLNNAWYRNDHKQTNLLNEPTKQIQVETNTIDEANKPAEPKA